MCEMDDLLCNYKTQSKPKHYRLRSLFLIRLRIYPALKSHSHQYSLRQTVIQEKRNWET